MWKVVLFLCLLSIPAVASVSTGIMITGPAAQFGGSGTTSANAITWGNGVMVSWGNGTILVGN